MQANITFFQFATEIISNCSPCHYSCKLWIVVFLIRLMDTCFFIQLANIYNFFHCMTMIQPVLNPFRCGNHDQLTTSLFQVFWTVKLNLTSSLSLDPDTTFPSPPETKEKWSSQVWSLERRSKGGPTVAIVFCLSTGWYEMNVFGKITIVFCSLPCKRKSFFEKL